MIRLKIKTGLEKRNKTKPVFKLRNKKEYKKSKEVFLDLTELEIESRKIENYGYFNEYR